MMCTALTRLHVAAHVFSLLTGLAQSLAVPSSANSTAKAALGLGDDPWTQYVCHGWPQLRCGKASVTSAMSADADVTAGAFAPDQTQLAQQGLALMPGLGGEPQEPEGPEQVNVGPTGVPVSMSPRGHYGRHAASQAAYMSLLKQGMHDDNIKPGAVILDLGCADGVNSLALLELVKKKTDSFTYTLVDLPGNDWETTRKVVQSQLQVYPEDAATAGHFPQDMVAQSMGTKRGVLLARTFYDRLAPDASVDLAVAGTSLQYLSSEFHGSRDKAAHAREDYIHFLRGRASELKPDGTLHIAAPHTRFPGRNHGQIWNLAERVLTESAEMGLITARQKNAWRWPGYARTTEEFINPLRAGQVPELVLEKFKVVMVDSPYWTMAQGDPSKFVELYVPSVLAWIGPYMLKTLPSSVLDLLEVKLYSEVMLFPELWKRDFNQAILKLRKRDLHGADDGSW